MECNRYNLDLDRSGMVELAGDIGCGRRPTLGRRVRLRGPVNSDAVRRAIRGCHVGAEVDGAPSQGS